MKKGCDFTRNPFFWSRWTGSNCWPADYESS